MPCCLKVDYSLRDVTMNDARISTPQPDTGKRSGRVKNLRRVIKYIGLFLFVLIASVSGVFLYQILYPAPVPPTLREIDESIYQAMASATPPAAYSSQVYQTILPSLVYIQTQQEGEDAQDGYGVGTGVIVNQNGDILTALHVVGDAIEIEVYFADGSQSTAEIIAAEPQNDIALLQSHQPPQLIVPAVLGSSDRMRVGDEAFAVGNPLGLVASMSAGVISGFNRSIPIDEETDLRLEGLIQFDTAVNPGNSGGPLLNRQGQVIGIVTALANPSDQNFFVGIGFAVPIGTAVAAGGGGPSY
jgi:S1-C subfamily serine protease